MSFDFLRSLVIFFLYRDITRGCFPQIIFLRSREKVTLFSWDNEIIIGGEISVTRDAPCDMSRLADRCLEAPKTNGGWAVCFVQIHSLIQNSFKGMSECYNTNVNVTTAATSGINYVIISGKQHLLFWCDNKNSSKLKRQTPLDLEKPIIEGKWRKSNIYMHNRLGFLYNRTHYFTNNRIKACSCKNIYENITCSSSHLALVCLSQFQDLKNENAWVDFTTFLPRSSPSSSVFLYVIFKL